MRLLIPLAFLACTMTVNPKDSPPSGPPPECPEDTGPTVPEGAVVCVPDAEVCDGIDNDCDGLIDEDITASLYLQDCDGDGLAEMVDVDFTLEAADGPFAIISCQLADDLPLPFHAGCVWTRSYGDCDDSDATVAPGHFEFCDGKDNDCNGDVDDGVTTTHFLDYDGDGYGTDMISVELDCTDTREPPFFSSNNADCNDEEGDAYPGHDEVCNNGIDDDCDGSYDEAPCV